MILEAPVSTGQGGLTQHEWTSRIEKRLENLENFTAQELSKHDKEDTDMFKALWIEINSIKLQNAKTVWMFGLITAVGTVALTMACQVIMKKLGL